MKWLYYSKLIAETNEVWYRASPSHTSLHWCWYTSAITLSRAPGWPSESAPLSPLGEIWDLMLVWKKGSIEKELSLCYSIMYCYNGAQRYEQCLQVGRLFWTLILLGLALYLLRTSVSSVLMVLYNIYIYISILNFFLLISFSLPYSELSLVGLALDLVD